jgi:hypothetical protein
MKAKINLSDFEFNFKGFNVEGSGMYEVTYTSPLTGKKWNARIIDTTLIDAIKDLNVLKKICKY